MSHGAPTVRLICAFLWISAAWALNIHSENDWAGPMDAHAQQQLSVRSRHPQHSPSSVAHSHHSAGARRLLTPSRQSQLTATGSGILTYSPIGYSIDGADFTQFTLEAHSNPNVTGVRLGPGSYHVYAKAEDGSHIYITCSTTRDAPFEIDFTGVFFYFTDHQFGGVKIDTCSNVHFHGPYEQTWTDDQLSFTQGKILALDNSSDPPMATIQVDDGYPSDRILLHEVIQVLTFANDTRLMRNVPCPDMGTPSDTSRRAKLSYNTYQFPFGPNTCAYEPGDLFVARSTTGARALEVWSTGHTTLADISIYSSGGFGMFQSGGTNNTFMRIHVRPFPRPLGNDGALPLLAACTDGFHAVDAHRGTILRDNFIVNTGDDGLAMHGEYYAVADSDPSAKTVVIASSGGWPFDKNDSLTFYAPDTECWGTGVIANLYSVNQPSSTNGKYNEALSVNSNGQYKYDDCDFMQAEFKHWPERFNNIKSGDVLSSPSANGNGFAILNNTIGNLRGRGILVKSSNGVIADNTLFNLPFPALQLAPEYWWQEADFVHNVLVANNVINSNGSGIWLGINPGIGGPTLYTNNYAVDFVGNKIVNTQTGPFTVTSAAQITIANTTFVNVLCTSNDTQAFDWATPGSLIMLANVDDVAFWGNTVVNTAACVNPQGSYKDPVSMVNSTNVQGLAPPASVQPAVTTLLQRDSAP